MGGGWTGCHLKCIKFEIRHSQIVEVLSEYEREGFVCFRDFCLIVSEKINNEDDEFLIKSIFKSFKGSAIPLNPNLKAPKRNFFHEVVTFDEFRNGMRKLPEFVSEVIFYDNA